MHRCRVHRLYAAHTVDAHHTHTHTHTHTASGKPWVSVKVYMTTRQISRRGEVIENTRDMSRTMRCDNAWRRNRTLRPRARLRGGSEWGGGSGGGGGSSAAAWRPLRRDRRPHRRRLHRAMRHCGAVRWHIETAVTKCEHKSIICSQWPPKWAQYMHTTPRTATRAAADCGARWSAPPTPPPPPPPPPPSVLSAASAQRSLRVRADAE